MKVCLYLYTAESVKRKAQSTSVKQRMKRPQRSVPGPGSQARGTLSVAQLLCTLPDG